MVNDESQFALESRVDFPVITKNLPVKLGLLCCGSAVRCNAFELGQERAASEQHSQL